MREIKFRAWHKKKKKYYVVFSLHLQAKSVGLKGSLYDYDKVILEQFTGLHDKNGVEIYEGDIIKVGDYCINEEENYYHKQGHYKKGDMLVIISVVPLLEVRDLNDYKALVSKSDVFMPNLPRAKSKDIWNFQSSLKVIGNIHENTELLGETK